MAITGLATFDQTVQETNTWLHDIERGLHDPRRQLAYHALRGVLFALRDRLPVNEAHKLAAQFPMLVRGLFFEGYHPAGKPDKFHRKAFLDRVADELQQAGGANVEDAVCAVFTTLNARLSPGTSQHVRRMLPKDLRKLWPEAVRIPA